MPPTILVTNDGSQQALRALPHAALLAGNAGADLILLRVLDPDAELTHVAARDRPAVIRALVTGWQAELTELLANREIRGRAEVRILGEAERLSDAVVSAAQEHDALLIAMHSRGAGAIRHALLGSVALGVLGGTSLPVMLTGPHAADPPAIHREGYRLIITSDGSPASDIVVISMAPVLAAIDGHVRLLHICELRSGRPAPETEVALANRHLEGIRKILPPTLQSEVETAVCCDACTVANDILRAAERYRADAIALSTHGHSALRHLIAGSNALDLLSQSPVPLILTRYPG